MYGGHCLKWKKINDIEQSKNALPIMEGIGYEESAQGLFKNWKMLKFRDKIQLEVTESGKGYVRKSLLKRFLVI